MTLLGVDIGTTGAKAVLTDSAGTVICTASATYPLLTPRPNWTEQDPGAWWEAATSTIREVLSRSGGRSATVGAVGLTGQMHGLVPLDGHGKVLRPSILWNDQRTSREVAWIIEKVGHERILKLTGNPVLTGFTAPKVIWLRNNEPAVFERIAHILLPKDYVRYRLTGEFATDVSDASGTSLFDVHHRTWAPEMLQALEIPKAWLPQVTESSAVSGVVSADAATATGLPQGIPVVAGASDQAAEALGVGVVRPGIVSVTIGTSGVVFASLEVAKVDPLSRTHTFCHAAPGRWHVMGVMLSAGGSLRWVRDTIRSEEWFRSGFDPYELMSAEATIVKPGAEGLVFLPYLTGERTPHADPLARGAFVGLTLRHGRASLVRAVMEGVAMGLRDSLEILRAMNVPVTQVRASGGGARSQLWRHVLADVFNTELVTTTTSEGAALGAALLAGVGCQAFPSIEHACDNVVSVGEKIDPDPTNVATYEELYRLYVETYLSLRSTMHTLSAL